MFLHDDPGYHCIPKSRVTNDKVVCIPLIPSQKIEL